MGPQQPPAAPQGKAAPERHDRGPARHGFPGVLTGRPARRREQARCRDQRQGPSPLENRKSKVTARHPRFRAEEQRQHPSPKGPVWVGPGPRANSEGPPETWPGPLSLLRHKRACRAAPAGQGQKPPTQRIGGRRWCLSKKQSGSSPPPPPPPPPTLSVPLSVPPVPAGPFTTSRPAQEGVQGGKGGQQGTTGGRRVADREEESEGGRRARPAKQGATGPWRKSGSPARRRSAAPRRVRPPSRGGPPSHDSGTRARREAPRTPSAPSSGLSRPDDRSTAAISRSAWPPGRLPPAAARSSAGAVGRQGEPVQAAKPTGGRRHRNVPGAAKQKEEAHRGDRAPGAAQHQSPGRPEARGPRSCRTMAGPTCSPRDVTGRAP